MSYVQENDSTQNAHIKHSNDSRQKPTWKNTETIRHMRDSNICRIMGKGRQTMTNTEKFAEQILDIACGGSKIAVDKATLEPIACGKLECKDCLFNVSDAMSCGYKRVKWAVYQKSSISAGRYSLCPRNIYSSSSSHFLV